LSILGHETGHLFLATASVRDPADANKRPMLGAQGVHWSFNFNSEASLLEGNRIRDDGAGAAPRFLTIGAVEGFSPLDQYLMGLRAPWEVPPTFLVQGSTQSASRLPQKGVSLAGNRRNIGIDELMSVEGPRRPDDALAQRRFRFAFILLADNPDLAAPEQIEQVERYRREFEPYFRRVTEARASADATLRRAVSLSAYPALELLTGQQAEIRLELETAPAADLRFHVYAPAACWESPAEILLPAGARTASFTLKATASCTAELGVEPEGVEYMGAYARVRVLSSR
jgi:hypothetical protein